MGADQRGLYVIGGAFQPPYAADEPGSVHLSAGLRSSVPGPGSRDDSRPAATDDSVAGYPSTPAPCLSPARATLSGSAGSLRCPRNSSCVWVLSRKPSGGCTNLDRSRFIV